MESAVPRWQEGSLLAFCQPEGGVVLLVGGCTAEGGRGEKRPEGYRCWIAPALDTVKERKQEIWGKVNLSLTLWPTTMCYPLQEASQTERERRPARGQETV